MFQIQLAIALFNTILEKMLQLLSMREYDKVNQTLKYLMSNLSKKYTHWLTQQSNVTANRIRLIYKKVILKHKQTDQFQITN